MMKVTLWNFVKRSNGSKHKGWLFGCVNIGPIRTKVVIAKPHIEYSLAKPLRMNCRQGIN